MIARKLGDWSDLCDIRLVTCVKRIRTYLVAVYLMLPTTYLPQGLDQHSSCCTVETYRLRTSNRRLSVVVLVLMSHVSVTAALSAPSVIRGHEH